MPNKKWSASYLSVSRNLLWIYRIRNYWNFSFFRSEVSWLLSFSYSNFCKPSEFESILSFFYCDSALYFISFCFKKSNLVSQISHLWRTDGFILFHHFEIIITDCGSVSCPKGKWFRKTKKMIRSVMAYGKPRLTGGSLINQPEILPSGSKLTIFSRF